jgi:hypothetical protein
LVVQIQNKNFWICLIKRPQRAYSFKLKNLGFPIASCLFSI